MKLTLTFLFVSISSLVHAQRSDFKQINFTKADSIASLYPNYSLKDRKKLTALLTDSLHTQPEKFRAIFKWITNNIAYDVDLYYRNMEKKSKLKGDRKALQSWNKTFSKLVQANLINKHMTVCSGYATLLEEMCMHASINSKTLSGYARVDDEYVPSSPNHAWNAVQFNDKWYLADATWASGYLEPVRKKFIKEFAEHYFLTDPEHMVLNHYPSDTTWMLLSKKPTLKDFKLMPVVYDAFYRHKLERFSPEVKTTKIKKGETITFRFTSNLPPPLKDVSIQIKDNKNNKTSIDGPLTPDAEGMYSIAQAFVNKGGYKVLLFVNYYAVLEYNVVVR